VCSDNDFLRVIFTSFKANAKMDTCTVLTFNNHEDFLAYKNTVKIKPEQVGISVNCESGKFRIAVVIKTELPIPNGFLSVKTKGGREMTIQVSSGLAKETSGVKFP
jgi:hypothetical protein